MKAAFTDSGHLMAQWISRPSHIAGGMSLVFAETNFHWVNGTKTRRLVKRVEDLKHGAGCPAPQCSVSTAGQCDALQ